MHTVLAVGALLPAGIGLGCCLHRRLHWLGMAAMLAMVAGMADAMVLGHSVLPATGWLVVFGVVAAAQLVVPEPTRGLRLAELGVMSLLLVAMPPMASGPSGTMHHPVGHPVGHSVQPAVGHAAMADMPATAASAMSVLGGLALAAALVYVAHAVTRLLAATTPLARLETGMSVASVAAMSVMAMA